MELRRQPLNQPGSWLRAWHLQFPIFLSLHVLQIPGSIYLALNSPLRCGDTFFPSRVRHNPCLRDSCTIIQSWLRLLPKLKISVSPALRCLPTVRTTKRTMSYLSLLRHHPAHPLSYTNHLHFGLWSVVPPSTSFYPL